MATTYYIACYKKNKQDTIGYLFLQNKGRKNRAKKALGISIKYELFRKYFNDKEQRFKSGLENYKLINEKIAKVFEEYEATEVKIVSNKAKKSFLKYWTDELALETNQGSKRKYEVHKTKFEKFLKSISKSDIAFSELTPDFFRKYQHYLKTAKDPKPLNSNSVSHYIKGVGIFINKKIEDDPHLFKIHPLQSVKYDPKKEVERKVLDDNEFDKLITTRISDTDLDYFRDVFMFQLFSNGMRVSDLLLLRWSNLFPDLTKLPTVGENNRPPEPYIKYTMFKTDKVITVPFTLYVCKALMKTMGEHQILSEYLSQEGGEENRKNIAPYIADIAFEDSIEYRGYNIRKENSNNIKIKIDEHIESLETNIIWLKEETAELLLLYLQKNNCESQFVFPVLNNKDFAGISDSETVFKDTIATNELLYSLLLNGEKKYREKLKKVADKCKIKKMPSHSARHTFAKLMDLEGAPTHDIKDKLGHTKLDTTSEYMKHPELKTSKQSNRYVKSVGNKTEYLDKQ